MNYLNDEKQHQEWINKLLIEAQILAPEYPCKGESGWLPYGYRIAENLIKIFSEKMDTIGFSEIALPSFVKGEIFLKQCNNIKNFKNRVYWSDPFIDNDTHVVKPTIEAQISSLFSIWLTEGRNTPFKFYTCRSVGRYETGRTLPLWKERIVWPFFEGHSMHTDEDDLIETIENQNKILKEVYDLLGLQVFFLQRPKINKRLNEYSERRLESISITPYKRVVILSSIYDLGEIFSKVYSLKSKDDKYFPMVNFAFSGRLLGTVFSNFCDQHGLRLPSILSPDHIRIIPLNNDSTEQNNYSSEISEYFNKNNIRGKVDITKNNFKNKIKLAKLQGVPFILVIGNNEITNKTVSIIRRDTNTQQTILLDELKNNINQLLNEYDNTLNNWTKSFINDIYQICIDKESYNESKLQDKLLQINLCDNESCLKEMSKDSDIEIIGALIDNHIKPGEKCINCDKIAKQQLLLGKKWKGEK